MKINYKIAVLALLAFIGIIITSMTAPFGQDPQIHDLADQRRFLSIPYFNDVMSNLSFFLVGMWGLRWVVMNPRKDLVQQRAWKFFFISLIGVFLGSSYYHLHPNLDRLLLDRLAIAVSLMALFSLILIERIVFSFRRFILPVLVVLGLTSVLYWWGSEKQGWGDLRFYLFIQYYSMLAIPLICFFYPKKGDRYIYLSVVLYGIAKIFEMKDFKIFYLTNEYLSGHTLKHLICAVSAYFIHLKSVTSYNRSFKEGVYDR